MDDSIPNRIVTSARFIDLEGPNMRDYYARTGKDYYAAPEPFTHGTIICRLSVSREVAVHLKSMLSLYLNESAHNYLDYLFLHRNTLDRFFHYHNRCELYFHIHRIEY